MGQKTDHIQGSVLVLGLIVTIALALLSLSYLGLVISEVNITPRSYNSTAAMNLAEAGIEAAIVEFNSGGADFTPQEGWSGTTEKTKIANLHTPDGKLVGEYFVRVTGTGTTNPKLEATGYVPNRTRIDRVARKVRVVLTEKSLFNYGLFSGSITTPLNLSGTPRVDSYDSDHGSYDPSNPGHNGDVGSNNDINLSGNCRIYGNATPGPGHSVSVSGGASVVPPGSTAPAPSAETLPSIPASYLSLAQQNNNNNVISQQGNYFSPGQYDLNVSNGNINLPSGTYYFTSITVSGNASMTAQNDVVIYVEGGAITVTGTGLLNASRVPSNLIIYSTGLTVTLSGSADFYGAIYAPGARTTITGNTGFYGSMISDSFNITGNANFHYDRSLKNKSVAFAGYSVSAWQEK